MQRAMVSIVIPVLNEGGIICESVPEIIRHALSVGTDCEVIVVDDGSTDNTWEAVSALAQEYNNIVKGIKLSRNFGKEAAIVAGLDAAVGDAVIIMDADLQHPPDLIPKMIAEWKPGRGDIVEAVKASRGQEPFFPALGARLFYWLMKRLAAIDLDKASDFKLLDRRVVDAHNALPEASRFFRGIIFWLGFKKVQIPFSVGQRKKGASKWSLMKLITLAVEASTAFSTLPLHLVTIMGIVILVVSILLGIQTFYMKLSGAAVSGFATVILLLLFIGSALMLSLGIIGLYISRIYEEVKRRPKYVIEASTVKGK
jgi:glycosyltransferase involved in cell wall biosynthesis